MADLFTQARLLQIECRMNGMIAENKQRELLGNSMAYQDTDFQLLFNEIQILIDQRIR
jgi:hypothetical protein